ncbi:hypothetical protein V1477_021175 [Vespula maculifrons]|uniref:Uncharacterized protein n=1 Tax=Vespula maculifrons TaxID=7453 RepID=A0ABD2AGY0_VESMC
MNKIRILQSKVVESIRLSAGDETLVHFVSSRLSSKFLRSPEEETPRIIYKFSICHDNGNHLLKQDPLVRHSCKAQLLTEGYGTIFATYLTVDGFDVYKRKLLDKLKRKVEFKLKEKGNIDWNEREV